ncbi:hypothetical protein KZ498_20390 [Haloarcula sp. 1CSR25-25]|nr:hypothetical protein [Haloarcula sp. 1CSR25-25]
MLPPLRWPGWYQSDSRVDQRVSDFRIIAVIQLTAVATKRTTVIVRNESNCGRFFGMPGYKPKKYNTVIRREKRNTAVTIVA